MGINRTGDSGNVLTAVGIPEPDVELTKADLVARIHRLLDQRRVLPEEAAALLRVDAADLPALLRGRLATCSLDQLVRLLTWLGDDVEILIRPRLRRTSRGSVRVFQAAGIDRADHVGRGSQVSTSPKSSALTRPIAVDDATERVPHKETPADDRQLLDKWQVEEMTSLDITTIYRKMKAGSFPQPVKVGRRRVAWRASDIMRWQQELQVGTEAAVWMPARKTAPGPRRGGKSRRTRS
jgi:prophage regulatory protein